MSTQSQEVRTVFTWDTADVDKGVQRMEKAMQRLQDSEKKAGQGSKSGHGNDSNFAMGVRDLAEGRGVNALQRFGHAIGATALRLSGYMLAMKAAGEATHYMLEELDKYDTNSRALEDRLQSTSRASTFATAGMAPGELAGLRQQNIEGLKAENEQQGGLQNAGEMLNKPKWWNVPGVIAAAGIGVVRDLQGKRTPEQEQAASEQRAKLYAKEQTRLKGLYSSSLLGQADRARYNAPGEYNDPYEAKRKELDIQQQVEESAAKAAGASKQDLEAIKERYEYLRKTVTAEGSLAAVRFNNAKQLLEIEGGAGGTFSKGLAMQRARIDQGEALLKGGDLNQEQRRAEELNIARARNAQRSAIMGRYLNPDGTARNPAAVQKDFLKDAAEERARARFIRRYEAGGYDPVTGRRRATGDKPGSGLRSGGLKTGHIRGGSNAHSADEWELLFPRSHAEGGSASSGSGGKSATDLYTLLDQRLPKGVA